MFIRLTTYADGNDSETILLNINSIVSVENHIGEHKSRIAVRDNPLFNSVTVIESVDEIERLLYENGPKNNTETSGAL